MDLFEAQLETEARQLAKQQAREILRDPAQLRQLVSELVEERDIAIAERDEAVARFEKYLDAEGYIDAAQAAATLQIPYIGPDGNRKNMGRNYALQVFEIDRIVINTASGYRLSSHWEKRGYGCSRVVNRNGMLRSVALFNGDGIKALVRKYEQDSRVWRSSSERELWHE